MMSEGMWEGTWDGKQRRRSRGASAPWLVCRLSLWGLFVHVTGPRSPVTALSVRGN